MEAKRGEGEYMVAFFYFFPKDQRSGFQLMIPFVVQQFAIG
jgi:hypothetical protein